MEPRVGGRGVDGDPFRRVPCFVHLLCLHGDSGFGMAPVDSEVDRSLGSDVVATSFFVLRWDRRCSVGQLFRVGLEDLVWLRSYDPARPFQKTGNKNLPRSAQLFERHQLQNPVSPATVLAPASLLSSSEQVVVMAAEPHYVFAEKNTFWRFAWRRTTN